MPAGTDRYNVDPGNPGAQLEERLRAIEQHLRAIEGKNPLNNAVFSGTLRNVDANGNTILSLSANGLSMYDDDGELRVRIGLTGTDHYGVLVLDDDGTTARLEVDERGINSPYLAAPFRGVISDTEATTSATFTALFTATLEQVVSSAFHVTVLGNGDAATTGEMRLHIPLTGATTEAVPIATAGTSQQFRWLHGLGLSAGPVNVNVEARRTGGAGNVYVARPSGLWQASDSFSVADGVV